MAELEGSLELQGAINNGMGRYLLEPQEYLMALVQSVNMSHTRYLKNFEELVKHDKDMLMYDLVYWYNPKDDTIGYDIVDLKYKK